MIGEFDIFMFDKNILVRRIVTYISQTKLSTIIKFIIL